MKFGTDIIQNHKSDKIITLRGQGQSSKSKPKAGHIYKKSVTLCHTKLSINVQWRRSRSIDKKLYHSSSGMG